MQHHLITSSYSPGEILKTLVSNGTFNSRVRDRIDLLRQKSDGPYASDVLSYGQEEAERKLVNFVAERRWEAFADSVGAVAESLAALAQIDEANADTGSSKREPLVRMLRIAEEMHLPCAYSHQQGVLFLTTNPHVAWRDCTPPKGSAQFGRSGEIGLRAVGIAVDKKLQNPQLLLVLPHPRYRTEDTEHTRMGFAVVTIGTNGYTSGVATQYVLRSKVLDYALGMTGAEEMIGRSQMRGISAALDFPGSYEYLARHIPDLSGYLKDAAANLSGQHNH